MDKFGLNTTWTMFHDKITGGLPKTQWSRIYIQATRNNAYNIFVNRFMRDPLKRSCSCCSDDYLIREGRLMQITLQHRERLRGIGTVPTLERYVSMSTKVHEVRDKNILFITKDQIREGECNAHK